MKGVFIGAALAGLILVGGRVMPALAQMDQTALNAAAKICVSETAGMAKAVEACTTVLDNTDMSPQGKATVLMFRGSALGELGRHEEAIMDLDRSVGIYETASDKASWSQTVVGNMASSYFHRGLSKEALKRCVEAKLDYKKAADTAVEISRRRNYELHMRAACT